MFVYDCEDEVLLLCEITHNVAFPGKGIWAVWDFIMWMWGLEVHILNKRGDSEQANTIIQTMDNLWMFPPTLPPTVPEHEMARRNSFTLSRCSNEEHIANARSASLANEYRFSSLFNLIGYGSTGLFPNLNKEKNSVDKIVDEYIQKLRNIK